MIGDEFAAVLAGAASGDDRAMERLYRDVAPLVVGYLRSNGLVEADDVASEVFVSMIRGLPKFSGDEQGFRSWLMTIAHRRMVDAVRRSLRVHEQPMPTETLPLRLGAEVDAELDAVTRLESQGVLAAIEALTTDQRAAVMLRVLADLSVADIGRVLGKPDSAVKALLRRGLASLRRTVDPGGITPTEESGRRRKNSGCGGVVPDGVGDCSGGD